jgi:predicted site-specific integrase-resolvase
MLPAGVKMEQLTTGTVVVTEAIAYKPADALSVAIYAWVSCSDQKNDLESQLGRLAAYANGHGWSVIHSVAEIGSDLNEHRPKLMKLLADLDISAIVVEHTDRLMRFVSNMLSLLWRLMSMEEGTKKVAVGVGLANQAGDGLHRIVESVKNLQGMVQQIASATE